MAKKIIYITPGQNDIIPGMSSFESDREGDLTKETQSNLTKILDDVVIPEIGADTQIGFKSNGFNNPSRKTISRLQSLFNQSDLSAVKSHSLGRTKTLDIDSVKELEEELVVIGIARYELEDLIQELKNNGYEINDSEKTIDSDSIYTLTVDVDDKKSVQFNEFGNDEE